MKTSLKPSLSLCNVISSSVQSGVRRLFTTHLRCFSVSVSKHQKHRPHVGIVGSGPAGFYTAQQILKVGILNNYYCLFPFSDWLRKRACVWGGGRGVRSPSPFFLMESETDWCMLIFAVPWRCCDWCLWTSSCTIRLSKIWNRPWSSWN